MPVYAARFWPFVGCPTFSPVLKRVTELDYLRTMREERIEQLCAQLFRTENAGVIETVAAQLHGEIDEYVRDANCGMTPIFEFPTRAA